jgi:glycosyltransferase involved in cell wall biosynthesis
VQPAAGAPAQAAQLHTASVSTAKPAVADPRPSAGTEIYTAQRGEAIPTVARRYLGRTSYLTSSELSDAIRAANHKSDSSNILKAKEEIVIPGILATPITEKTVPVAKDFEVRAIYLTGIMAASDYGLRIIKHWREGNDIVYGTRASRAGETGLKKLTAAGFYRVMSRLSATPVPRNTGDYRLLSRRALDGLKQLRERQRFMKGLFTWVGFQQKAVVYDRDPRFAGRSKFNYWRLWNFALEGITSFSTAPLRIATYVGVLTALLAFVFGLFVFGKALLFGDPVRGYPTLMVVVLFLGGAQLMALGLIGEYLGRLYMEAKQRPLYLIDAHHAAQGVEKPPADALLR